LLIITKGSNSQATLRNYVLPSSSGGPAKNVTTRRQARRQSVSCIIEQICHITHFGPEKSVGDTQ
jgi:hypothetical protein